MREMTTMTDPITVGTILVEEGAYLPNSLLHFQRRSSSTGWPTVKGTRAEFEKEIQDAGWTLFFMAGEIKTTVFGFDGEKSLRVALTRLITNVKSQHCNSIEITGLVRKSFLRVPYVSVTAHARHLQQGTRFSGNGAPVQAPISQAQFEWRLPHHEDSTLIRPHRGEADR
jgi:hypothetical protein